MPLTRFIMVLLLSCLCVQGAVYRITGIIPPSDGDPKSRSRFAAGSSIDGKWVGGQFASYIQVRAFTRFSTSRRFAVSATVRRSQRIDLRRRPISRR